MLIRTYRIVIVLVRNLDRVALDLVDHVDVILGISRHSRLCTGEVVHRNVSATRHNIFTRVFLLLNGHLCTSQQRYYCQ